MTHIIISPKRCVQFSHLTQDPFAVAQCPPGGGWLDTNTDTRPQVVLNYQPFEELSLLLEDTPSAVRRRMISQHDGAPPQFHHAMV
ncbi:hypothetical protein PR048_030177 [Dryococelus australis]|uniref:Uncharacterized protein n=1 Tax=Dryococelus australis TaxID=614101 RepID=A0ABQ9G8M8_9NEOP|nr:hypothetical protein PR048_030177 [Dryococelus australis]